MFSASVGDFVSSVLFKLGICTTCLRCYTVVSDASTSVMWVAAVSRQPLDASPFLPLFLAYMCC